MLNNKVYEGLEIPRDYYYFYIFYKNQCICSINLKKDEQEKTAVSNAGPGSKNKTSKSETEKLLLGSIYAINYLCFNIQPNKKLKNLYKSSINGKNMQMNINMSTNTKTHNKNITNTQNNLHIGNFNTFNTPLYKLHYFETLTAHKFVLITHKNVPNLSNFLRDIYKTIFLDLIILNPLYKIGDEIRDNQFDEKIIERIKGLATVQ
ncbi:trafficking protein particle complex subunit 1, putative (BET5) [Plasmodium ovale wallikeri]|uniref:Trafficking protein particle complex subunit n=2 Tax=Plasmodium ovale TaxID=36330 RepID=A0A1A8ZRI4_PLAOA|nr:trafficking protein particle complex subunit 1, putative (BET5) [Plasmodium ovale wallikeri]SBT47079.1 trafficking protein particle complex subunit 1, putative (BET5) [Plasmodium ovale wallikeri]SBT79014.1 trafficking protein particle complex subunit 1, putative [Plasmodium ovale]